MELPWGTIDDNFVNVPHVASATITEPYNHDDLLYNYTPYHLGGTVQACTGSAELIQKVQAEEKGVERYAPRPILSKHKRRGYW